MSRTSPLIAVYSLTLLLSAGLLFSVQPMFARMILPLLGGTPNVWNTSMLFFQAMLLGGYAYAHFGTKYLGVRAQALLHLALIAVFFFILPFGIPPGAAPPADGDPTLWQLSLMTAAVGGPFFVLAGSAPMLQRWFAATPHKDAANPYFLYGASNLGSVTALLAYPALMEPMLALDSQAQLWKYAYAALFLMTLASASLVWPYGQKASFLSEKTRGQRITWRQRTIWLILAFIPSSMMLGVTTYITSEVASVPLLWIAPLAMYVGSFIIVFARKPIISSKNILDVQGACLIAALALLISDIDINPWAAIALHFALFFFSALACHMELANARPETGNLTEFYLIMSVGGVLGGFFNAIIAPNYFIIPLEYAIALAAAAFMRHSVTKVQPLKSEIAALRTSIKSRGIDSFFSWNFLLSFAVIFSAVYAYASPQNTVTYASAAVIGIFLLLLVDRRWVFAGLVAFTLALFPPGYIDAQIKFTDVLYKGRNFFGIVKVADTKSGERILLHGVTNHGTQALDPKLRSKPLSYYSEFSPAADIFEFLDQKQGPQKIAVLGLGSGAISFYKKSQRSFDFFEINPAVIEIAKNKNFFTYISDCGDSCDIIAGDGRLTIQEKPDESYDLIFMDAFSSDNIPVHLLTIEAIQSYLKKLKPDGVLVFHISNRYIDLEPVLAEASGILDIPGYSRASSAKKIEGTDLIYYPAHYFSFTRNDSMNKFLEKKSWTKGERISGVRPWTDQYSNILSVLGNKVGQKRFEIEFKKHKKSSEAKDKK